MAGQSRGQVMDKIRNHKHYYKTNGDINIPVNYISDDGLSLGNWLSQLKAGRKKR